jgi:exosortase J
MKASVLASPATDLAARETPEQPVHPTPDWHVGAWVTALALAGTVAMAPVLLKLWDIWTGDPLKSIGMLIVPASVILTLRVWRRYNWEMRGSWWGLLLAVAGLCMSIFRHSFNSRLLAGPVNVNLGPHGVALYLFGSGFVLLFAGPRIWRRAWFPLVLLLCAQPGPAFFLVYGDLPLQEISARIARSFAVLIGFPPASTEMLRLMFTPKFGMFIAPGCDGVRGALTMGYLALITGYIKRFSVPRWIAWTIGGVALGYVFNLIRLCALVIYYRIAMGHSRLEQFAAQADYIIGGCLFLIAALLFLWIISRADPLPSADTALEGNQAEWTSRERRQFPWRAVAFAVPALLLAVPGVQAIRAYRKPFLARVNAGAIRPAQLDALMPKELSGYILSRAWQERVNGNIRLEDGAYGRPQHDEAIIGVWLPEWGHNMHVSWMVRGETPLLRADRTFITARGPAAFDTAFYSDGISDSIAGNAYCSPTSCIPSPQRVPEGLVLSLEPPDFETPGKRAVSIFFRIDRPHTSADQSAVFAQLTEEAKAFVAGVDFGEISRRFQ